MFSSKETRDVRRLRADRLLAREDRFAPTIDNPKEESPMKIPGEQLEDIVRQIRDIL
jgi:hypothetical protein